MLHNKMQINCVECNIIKRTTSLLHRLLNFINIGGQIKQFKNMIIGYIALPSKSERKWEINIQYMIVYQPRSQRIGEKCDNSLHRVKYVSLTGHF